MAVSVAQTHASANSPASASISWEAFQHDHLQREDGYDYEWLDGVVERKPISMDKHQLFILRNLQDFFMKLRLEQKVVGNLLAEADLLFNTHHRRPDICWLSSPQIDRLAMGEDEIPAFVIEIISSNDMAYRIQDKMNDYRDAGVEVVWHIFPKHEQVHIYTGKNLEQMTICTAAMLCSAAPALAPFELPVHQVFEKNVIF